MLKYALTQMANINIMYFMCTNINYHFGKKTTSTTTNKMRRRAAKNTLWTYSMTKRLVRESLQNANVEKLKRKTRKEISTYSHKYTHMLRGEKPTNQLISLHITFKTPYKLLKNKIYMRWSYLKFKFHLNQSAYNKTIVNGYDTHTPWKQRAYEQKKTTHSRFCCS